MIEKAAVLIATRNRADSLIKCLSSLCGLHLPPELDLEVLVIDNGSTDRTVAVARDFSSGQLPYQIRVMEAPRGGKSRALNAALAEVEVDYVLFTDDDMEFHPDWLLRIVEHFRQCQCVGVQGGVEVRCVGHRPTWVTAKVAGLYGNTSALSAPGGQVFEMYGLNMAARIEAARRAGPFNEALGPTEKGMGYSEDVEWSKRLAELGRLCFVPQALNYHCIPEDRFSRRNLWNRQYGMVREEWRLRALRGHFPDPFAEFWKECRQVLASLVVRRGSFAGFEYGLEIAARCGRVSSLAEHCWRSMRRRP